jgi:hypothetical protein
VSIEALILGVVSAVRPATSQAAVFALLRSPAASRSLLAFTVAGYVVSVAIGFVVVVGFGGARKATDESTFTAIFHLMAGVAALGFAAGVQRGRVTRPRPAPGRRRSPAISERLRNPSALTAAAAGVATHVPGLIYLVALDSVAADEPGAAGAFAQIVLYNALWFALPMAALVLAIRSPLTARLCLDRLTAFASNHQDRLLVLIFGALGIYLTIDGIVHLL